MIKSDRYDLSYHCNFRWFSKQPSPLNGMVGGNHSVRWFSVGFWVSQPLCPDSFRWLSTIGKTIQYNGPSLQSTIVPSCPQWFLLRSTKKGNELPGSTTLLILVVVAIRQEKLCRTCFNTANIWSKSIFNRLLFHLRKSGFWLPSALFSLQECGLGLMSALFLLHGGGWLKSALFT